MKVILLQCKFILVEWLNFSSNLVPLPFRVYYFRLFGIQIGKKSTIHRHSKFFHVGKFKMGNNSTINFGCYLDNRRGIVIGNNVGIAHNTKIYTLGHDFNSADFKTKGESVIIEDDVFVFSNCLIMPGVKLHEGSIVLSGSVVTKDVAPFTVVGGNPAKKIKERNEEVDYTQKYRYLFAL